MLYKLQFADLLPYWNVLLQGLIFTIVLTVVSTVAGIAVGTAGASARTFGPSWLGRVVAVYVELIRNTPFIVQLFFIFFGLPALGLKLSRNHRGVPRHGDQSRRLFDRDHPRRHRGGPEGPHRGRRQPRHDASGRCCATSSSSQAFRKIYPALSSQIIIVMLGSAVVSQISAEDLTYAANFVASRNFRNFEVYLLAALIYLLLAMLTACAAARARPRHLQGEVSHAAVQLLGHPVEPADRHAVDDRAVADRVRRAAASSA